MMQLTKKLQECEVTKVVSLPAKHLLIFLHEFSSRDFHFSLQSFLIVSTYFQHWGIYIVKISIN